MTAEWLDATLRSRLTATQAQWLTHAVQLVTDGRQSALLQVYTEVSRQLGALPLIDAAGDAADSRCAHWSVTDAGRLRLLQARFAASSDTRQAVADAAACYELGDANEQQSWLRGVSYLPDPAAFLALVIDACRTNILPLFEAVACENPYPARYFPERNFNQLVLKALFNGVALARIDGLAVRANADLARMASDYAAERRAAGRAVPPDIDRALAGGAVHGTKL
jgi:hypothetical protein